MGGTATRRANFVYFVLFSIPNVLFIACFGIIIRIWAAFCQDVSFRSNLKARPLFVFRLAVGAYACLMALLYAMYFVADFLVVLSWHSVINMSFSLIAAFGFLSYWCRLNKVLNPRRMASQQRRFSFSSDEDTTDDDPATAADHGGYSDGVMGAGTGTGTSTQAHAALPQRTAAGHSSGAAPESLSILAAAGRGATYDPDLLMHGSAGGGGGIDAGVGDAGSGSGIGERSVTMSTETSGVSDAGDLSLSLTDSQAALHGGQGNGPLTPGGDRPLLSSESTGVLRRYNAARRSARASMMFRITAVAFTCAFCFVFRAACQVYELVQAASDEPFGSIQRWWWAIITAYYLAAEICPSFVVLVILRKKRDLSAVPRAAGGDKLFDGAAREKDVMYMA